jgi:hypothetical protein
MNEGRLIVRVLHYTIVRRALDRNRGGEWKSLHAIAMVPLEISHEAQVLVL